MPKADLHGRAIQFTDGERSRLTIRAKTLRRTLLSQMDTFVPPDTLQRWQLRFVAQKWNCVRRRSSGRSRIKDEMAARSLRMAAENPGCGYARILGALRILGYQVSRGTIANVLEEHACYPEPISGKRTKWPTLRQAQTVSIYLDPGKNEYRHMLMPIRNLSITPSRLQNVVIRSAVLRR